MLDAIILCGGRGTRLAPVIHDIPKPLAPVAGRPFLDYLLIQLAASGIVREVVLALGHLADRIVDHYQSHPPVIPLRFIRESQSLDTGGALINAMTATSSDPILAMNGDSFVGLDLAAQLSHHRNHRAEATVALIDVEDSGRYGRAELKGRRLVGFHEKQQNAGPGLVNAGVYILARSALARSLERCSFERDLLPDLILRGAVETMIACGPFTDIGLPETYAAAPAFINRYFDSHGLLIRSEHRSET